MPHFLVKYKNQGGMTEKIVVQGESEDEVLARVQKKGQFIIEIVEATEKSIQPAKGKHKREDLLMFTRLLSTVVRANIPLVTGLDIIAKQIQSPFFLNVVRDLEASLRDGLSLSESMERFPSVFDSLYLNMVRAGEVTGKMGDILPNLFQYQKKSYGLRKKVIAALLYPIIIFVISFGIILFFIFFLIPQIEEMFTSFGAQLPAITVIVLEISRFFREYVLLFAIMLGLMIGGFIYFKKTQYGALFLDKLYLRMPIFGELLQKIYMVRFAYTFSVLYGNDVAILEALRIVSGAMGNRYYANAIDQATADIEVGAKIEDSFAKSGAFPSLVIQMIAIGEASRRVDEMLSEVSDFYDGEVDVALESITGVIQPLAIVFLGIFIAVTLLALFLPIFNLSGIVS